MKILYLPAYYYPEKSAGSYLNEERNQEFADAGFEIDAYAPMPCRGISKTVRKEYKKKRVEKMYDGKMTLHRFSMYAEGRNPVLRALRYVFCWFAQGWKGLRAKDVDVVYLASTPPIQGILGTIIKKFRGIPFVYNLQDIFPDSLVGTGMTRKGSLLWKIGRKIEDFTYKHADKIIVISEDFKRNIMAKGVPEEKIEVIYNWVDENAVVPVAKEDNPLFEEFGISRDKFTVVYAGNLGNAQNIGIIMDAVRALKSNEDIQFVIFGKGGMEDEIRQAREQEQLDNLQILPLQPMERVSQVYGIGDVCIVACKPGLGGAAMPSKTWSIMSSGRAVLANFDEGELKSIVENNSCGVFTPAGDLDAFVRAIVQLSQDRDLCADYGRHGRDFILHNLTKEVGTSKYVEVIKSVKKMF